MAMKQDPRKTLLQQMEPYDREAARAAVRGFLDAKTSADGGAFKRKLLAALKQFDANPPPEPQPTRRTPRQ